MIRPETMRYAPEVNRQLLSAVNANKIKFSRQGRQSISFVPDGTGLVCWTLFTDSQYVKHGITQWISGWKRKGWITSTKEPVKNVDLWQRLDAVVAQHRVTWK